MVRGPIAVSGPGMEIGNLAKTMMKVAREEATDWKISNKRMRWPKELQSILEEGEERGIKEEMWEYTLSKELKSEGIDYTMSNDRGRLNGHRFRKIEEVNVARLALYGRGVSSGLRSTMRADVMKEVFGEDAFPVRGIPKIVQQGYDASMKGAQTPMQRMQALAQVFLGAMWEIPRVRLIYSLAIIMTAHPLLVSPGGDLASLSNKVWSNPAPSSKVKSHALWALAFCFCGLYYSGKVDIEGIDINSLRKGMLGKDVINGRG